MVNREQEARMRIAAVLTPWYRRESPSPEFAMMVSLLKRGEDQVLVYDLNNSLFNENFLLRKYWKYFLLDAPVEKRDEFFNLTSEAFSCCASQILSHQPDLIVFKITGKTYVNSIELARAIKEMKQNIIIIFSGALVISEEEVSSFSDGKREQPFDYIICGEDEAALPELIRGIKINSVSRLKRKDKAIDCINGPIIENLDELPFYDFSDFNLISYKVPERLEIFISRGCPWRCSFCVDWLTEKKYRSMSGKRIYKEVEYQKMRHNLTHIRFCDKTINGEIKAIDEFCDSVLGDPGNDQASLIHWSGDAMIRKEMSQELLLKMRRAGCVGLGYGLESGSQNVVNGMNKQFSIDTAERVIRDTHQATITTAVNFMVGFPNETDKDFQESLDFIERNKKIIDEIRLTFIGCRVYKHSILYRNPKRFNLDNLDTDFWSTKDSLNTYEERVKRYEIICQHILNLQIPLRVNSRITKKVVKVT